MGCARLKTDAKPSRVAFALACLWYHGATSRGLPGRRFGVSFRDALAIPNRLLHDKPVPLANMRSHDRNRVFVCCSNPAALDWKRPYNALPIPGKPNRR
jgi:hypothetical protein